MGRRVRKAQRYSVSIRRTAQTLHFARVVRERKQRTRAAPAGKVPALWVLPRLEVRADNARIAGRGAAGQLAALRAAEVLPAALGRLDVAPVARAALAAAICGGGALLVRVAAAVVHGAGGDGAAAAGDRAADELRGASVACEYLPVRVGTGVRSLDDVTESRGSTQMRTGS